MPPKNILAATKIPVLFLCIWSSKQCSCSFRNVLTSFLWVLICILCHIPVNSNVTNVKFPEWIRFKGFWSTFLTYIHEEEFSFFEVWVLVGGLTRHEVHLSDIATTEWFSRGHCSIAEYFSLLHIRQHPALKKTFTMNKPLKFWSKIQVVTP